MFTPYDHLVEIFAAWIAIIGLLVSLGRWAWRRVSPFLSKRWASRRLEKLRRDVSTVRLCFGHPRFAIAQAVNIIMLVVFSAFCQIFGLVIETQLIVVSVAPHIDSWNKISDILFFAFSVLPNVLGWWLLISARLSYNLLSDPARVMKKGLKLLQQVRNRWPDLGDRVDELMGEMGKALDFIQESSPELFSRRVPAAK